MSRDAAQDQPRSPGAYRHTAELSPDIPLEDPFWNLQYWPMEADYHAEETDTMQWLRQLDNTEPMTHEELQGSQPWQSAHADRERERLQTQSDPDASFARVSDEELR